MVPTFPKLRLDRVVGDQVPHSPAATVVATRPLSPTASMPGQNFAALTFRTSGPELRAPGLQKLQSGLQGLPAPSCPDTGPTGRPRPLSAFSERPCPSLQPPAASQPPTAPHTSRHHPCDPDSQTPPAAPDPTSANCSSDPHRLRRFRQTPPGAAAERRRPGGRRLGREPPPDRLADDFDHRCGLSPATDVYHA